MFKQIGYYFLKGVSVFAASFLCISISTTAFYILSKFTKSFITLTACSTMHPVLFLKRSRHSIIESLCLIFFKSESPFYKDLVYRPYFSRGPHSEILGNHSWSFLPKSTFLETPTVSRHVLSRHILQSTWVHFHISHF